MSGLAAPGALRLVLADDHQIVRDGLRRFIADTDDVEVVGEASNGNDAVAAVEEHRPDIAVLDIRMPEMDGLHAAALIRDRAPDTSVVVLSGHDDRRHVVEAVKAGARGYVLKTRDAEHLVQTIRLVAAGNMVIDPDLVVAVAEELTEAKTRDGAAQILTDRELEILQLLAFGHTNRDIGERLFISIDTVKTHVEHIFQKLGTNDRTAAVAEAFRRRLIE